LAGCFLLQTKQAILIEYNGKGYLPVKIILYYRIKKACRSMYNPAAGFFELFINFLFYPFRLVLPQACFGYYLAALPVL